MIRPLAFAALFALAAPAFAAEGPDAVAMAILATNPAMIADPEWAQKPTRLELANAYPDRAMWREKSGEVRLICRVRLDGTVNACGVLSESIQGYGFREGALSLTPTFRLTPKTVAGMPVDGAAVIVPVQFKQVPPNYSFARPIGQKPTR